MSFRFLGLILYIPDPCTKITLPYPVESWHWPEALLPVFVFILFWLTATQLNIQKEENEFYITSLTSRNTYENGERESLLARNLVLKCFALF